MSNPVHCRDPFFSVISNAVNISASEELFIKFNPKFSSKIVPCFCQLTQKEEKADEPVKSGFTQNKNLRFHLPAAPSITLL